MDEDDIIFWQDLLDLVAAGRASDLSCPFCQRGRVQVTQNARTTRLECASCHKFVEGMLPE